MQFGPGIAVAVPQVPLGVVLKRQKNERKNFFKKGGKGTSEVGDEGMGSLAPWGKKPTPRRRQSEHPDLSILPEAGGMGA